ncbi:Endopolyphosphatase [Linnemannia schmuckeri]|uniref:Endopolyphosphatase n=1 Tax=Linnemannia schmuckeri TaxID=64567 RepID=A0A9P5RNM8_9FUNG|nr:Endopolyphosphatase [Linnemannia schmuckeri]
MTDLHPDEHYLEGAAVWTSCHTIVDEDGDHDDNDISGQQKRYNNGRLYQHPLGHNNDRALSSIILRPALLQHDATSSSSLSVPVNTTIGGRYGAPNTVCDSPLGFIDATFAWIDKNLMDSIDFVVWTGDNARHDSDNTHPRTQEEINTLNKIVANKVLNIFPPGPDGRRIPIIPSIGNNDVYPHNILEPGPNPILQYFAAIWEEFIPESMTKTFVRGGYYAIEAVPDKIAVFSLNTLYFYANNAAVDGCKEEEQPGTEQMDWLETELDMLRERKMVAYLTGHVPPDKKSYSPTCYSRYTKISLAYQDVIVGHLYGHANIDHFFLLSHGDNKGGEEEGSPEGGLLEGEEEERVDEYDSFHALGLSTYLEDLWRQYDTVPKRAQLKDFGIVMVSPSVVPTFNPTLRVFSYQLGNNNNNSSGNTDDKGDRQDDTDNDGDDDDMEEQQELEEHFAEHLNTGRSASQWSDFTSSSSHHHRKPRKHRYRRPSPASPTTFGFLQEYTQYWCNLTDANNHATTLPTYEIEYRTREDYGLENLGVSEWLALARRIAREEDLKRAYLDRMVVQSGANTTEA